MTEALAEFITVDECAALLRLNRKTVYDAVREGELPGAKTVRGTIRIRKETVLAWFASEGVPLKQQKRSR